MNLNLGLSTLTRLMSANIIKPVQKECTMYTSSQTHPKDEGYKSAKLLRRLVHWTNGKSVTSKTQGQTWTTCHHIVSANSNMLYLCIFFSSLTSGQTRKSSWSAAYSILCTKAWKQHPIPAKKATMKGQCFSY